MIRTSRILSTGFRKNGLDYGYVLLLLWSDFNIVIDIHLKWLVNPGIWRITYVLFEYPSVHLIIQLSSTTYESSLIVIVIWYYIIKFLPKLWYFSKSKNIVMEFPISVAFGIVIHFIIIIMTNDYY